VQASDPAIPDIRKLRGQLVCTGLGCLTNTCQDRVKTNKWREFVTPLGLLNTEAMPVLALLVGLPPFLWQITVEGFGLDGGWLAVAAPDEVH